MGKHEKQPIARVQWVDRDELRANEYNPNHVAPIEMELLMTSILADGWTQPIVAKPDGEIVDGFHRWTVSAKDSIWNMTDGKVPVVYVEPDKSDQYASTIRHNRARGNHGVEHMAHIVRALIDDERKSYEEVMKMCGMEWEEVDRLYDTSGMTGRGSYEDGAFSAGWKPNDKREKSK